MLCSTCARRCRRAQTRASTAHQTILGSKCLRVAEAFLHRDMPRLQSFYAGVPWRGQPALPLDKRKVLHVNLMFAETCCWEPFVGRTAEAARTESAKNADGFANRAAQAMRWYVYKTKDATYEHCAGPLMQKDMHRQLLQRNPSGSSAFFKPFIDIFLLSMQGSECIQECIFTHLQETWCTYYGVSQIVNGLLGSDLPTDRAGKVKNHVYAFWASFLFFSPFGKAIGRLKCVHEPVNLSNRTVELQRFFFKLCELRKACNLRRQKWRPAYREFESRAGMARRLMAEYAIAWPCLRDRPAKSDYQSDSSDEQEEPTTTTSWMQFVMKWEDSEAWRHQSLESPRPFLARSDDGVAVGRRSLRKRPAGRMRRPASRTIAATAAAPVAVTARRFSATPPRSFSAQSDDSVALGRRSLRKRPAWRMRRPASRTIAATGAASVAAKARRFSATPLCPSCKSNRHVQSNGSDDSSLKYLCIACKGSLSKRRPKYFKICRKDFAAAQGHSWRTKKKKVSTSRTSSRRSRSSVSRGSQMRW